MKKTIAIITLLTVLSGCATKKFKDVSYAASEIAPRLNIFVPKNSKAEKLPILIFIHGGNWNSGNKNTYGWFGRNFAKKGVLTIIPDYTLSPNADYNQQTQEIAAIILWVKNHIADYKGDPNRIYLTGHSAGGHLAALAVLNPKYHIDPKIISGIILNDAAGLDMKYYLENHPPTTVHDYLATWSNDPQKWQDASPIYFLNKSAPPFLIYVGTKTYESIKIGNERFLSKLHQLQPSVKPIAINKSHIPMVLQYFWPSSDRFDEIIQFMNQTK